MNRAVKEKAYYRPTQVRHLKIIFPLNLDQESKISPVTLSLRIYQVKLGSGTVVKESPFPLFMSDKLQG